MKTVWIFLFLVLACPRYIDTKFPIDPSLLSIPAKPLAPLLVLPAKPLVPTCFPHIPYDKPGPYTVKTLEKVGPRNAFTIFMPNFLSCKYPIVSWSGDISINDKLLIHLASHGFIVVATKRKLGTGESLIIGASWVLLQDKIRSSPFYRKIKERVCAAGHLLGGRGAIRTATSNLVSCVLVIQPAKVSKTLKIDAPLFAISDEQMQVWSSTFTLIGIVKEQHSLNKYVTAWMYAQLLDDVHAKKLFYGKDCGICSDTNWTITREN